MISKKNFYFLRHGETDFNALKINHDERDISLNEKGRSQANLVQPIIAKLPIQAICVSPLRRARETAEIVAAQLHYPIMIVEELRECSGHEWLNMVESKPCENVQAFIQRTIVGINRSLSLLGPVLIVAHGGIHWAMCHQMNIKGHEKRIGNCVPVHFSVNEQKEWMAQCLFH